MFTPVLVLAALLQGTPLSQEGPCFELGQSAYSLCRTNNDKKVCSAVGTIFQVMCDEERLPDFGASVCDGIGFLLGAAVEVACEHTYPPGPQRDVCIGAGKRTEDAYHLRCRQAEAI